MARFRNARRAVTKAEDTLAEAAGTAGRAVQDAAETAAQVAAQPSPNPMTNLVLADVALRGGGQLLRHMVERGLLGRAYSPETARNLVKGRTMGQTLLGTAIARIATRSVPGALLVGGGLLAKTLYDRKHARDAERSGSKAVERQARRGK